MYQTGILSTNYHVTGMFVGETKTAHIAVNRLFVSLDLSHIRLAMLSP